MTVAQFGTELEGYFGGKYTPVQLREVKRWAQRRTPRTLELVYRYCVLNETTQYKIPPDIKALNHNLAEVFEAYPELTQGSYNQQIEADRKLLSDDHGFTEEELAENIERLNKVVSDAASARRLKSAMAHASG